MKKNNKSYILYKATSPSGKVYIGITCDSLPKRIAKHKYSSETKQYEAKFMKAIKKYGVKKLKWRVLEEHLTLEQALILEKEYIKSYDSYKNGYNATLGGDGAFGVKWSEEAKEKHKRFLKETYYDDPEWRKKKSEQTKEYYKNNPERLEKLKEDGRKSLSREEVKQKAKKARGTRECYIKSSRSRGCKPFNVYDIMKKEYVGTWELISECNRELGLSNGKVSSCLKGKRNHHKGYIFKYIDDPEVKGKRFNNIWLNDIKRMPNGINKRKNG